jgi:hypothetical protein
MPSVVGQDLGQIRLLIDGSLARIATRALADIA